jgi:ectoine hydroxylase-related dioxygenase (phytanoyl-CoA dioxygenase family)
MLTSEQIAEYTRAGYVIVPGLLGTDEVTSFRDVARTALRAEALAGEMLHKGDKDGNVTLLKIWHEAADDVYGNVARDERLVGVARDLIGKDIYLYSHKMTMKEPLEGGAWEWHQDYGYWYQNKCLAPDMLSVWIALDVSTRENGCLQVLPGSHLLGRLDHVRVNGQTVVDDEYLAAALQRFPVEFVEMQPGDGLVFHCNLLHRSDANTSDTPRWGYIASYNASDNPPFRDVREYGRYQELRPVPAGTFMNAGAGD